MFVARRLATLILLPAWIMMLASGCGQRHVVTVESQINALTDPMTFCLPSDGVSDMVSTCDPRGLNADWWIIPKPLDGRELYEALNVKGPGCLKRIWSTNVQATEWLFYFDGETSPRLALKPEELFGGLPGRKPIQGTSSGGAYSYLPLPYAHSLRVVLRMPKLDANARPYFHFNYERYSAGTQVTSWPQTVGGDLSNAILRASTAWQHVRDDDTNIIAHQTWRAQRLPAHQATTLFDGDGPGTVTVLAIRPDFSSGNEIFRSLMLRCLVLECTWDNASQPSVQVPLGDFFCNGLHPRSFGALPLAYLDGTYLCRFPMPFRHHVRIVIRNDGLADVAAAAAVDVMPGDVGDHLYFHAAFNTANSIVNSGAPLHLFQTTGCGKYVGCYLTALGMDGTWSILEGNESFFRDGGTSRVQEGTGVEDYFNAGWYYTGLFELPIHGLLEKAAMRTSQYRFHLTDPVTFRKNLRMEWAFEDSRNQARGYLSAASYWYQDRPGPAGSTIPAVQNRFPPLEQVGFLSIMDELFELERAGLIDEAEARCGFYAGALQKMPEHSIYELRRLAYREMRLGFDAVRNDYAAFAGATNLPSSVTEQARLLLWRGEKPHRAIFGAHAQADYRLFVDGRLIGEGNDPVVWHAWPVELPPGEHMLQAEVTPQHPPEMFFSSGLSAFFTNVVSDTSWDFSRIKPDGWPAQMGARNLWRPYETEISFFPSMTWWRFEPNAFPCVQSGQQRGGPFGDWANPPGRTVYLRRRIVVPEKHPDRPPMPPRLMKMPVQAVRPCDDMSNEGVTHGP